MANVFTVWVSNDQAISIYAKQNPIQTVICCSSTSISLPTTTSTAFSLITLSPPGYSNSVHWSSPLPRSLWHPFSKKIQTRTEQTAYTQSPKSMQNLQKIWHLLKRLRRLALDFRSTQMSKWKHCCECCVIDHSSKQTGVEGVPDRGRRSKAQPPPPPKCRCTKSSFQVEFLIVVTF